MGGIGRNGFAVNTNSGPLLGFEFILHKNISQKPKDRNSLTKSLFQPQWVNVLKKHWLFPTFLQFSFSSLCLSFSKPDSFLGGSLEGLFWFRLIWNIFKYRWEQLVLDRRTALSGLSFRLIEQSDVYFSWPPWTWLLLLSTESIAYIYIKDNNAVLESAREPPDLFN